MKINTVLIPLFLLSFATVLYAPIKAASINQESYQVEGEKSSPDTSSTYRHGDISSINTKAVNRAVLKQGLVKIHQDAIAAPYKNTYVYTTLIAHWVRKNHLILQPSELNIIIDYTAEQRPVYFFVGSTGAGKSTAIFALQGNKVEEKEKSEDDWSRASEKETRLTYKATIDGPTPTIGASTRGQTVEAIVYYPGDTAPKMAFCDTEGFGGRRPNVSEAAKCISSFAPFFALKTNQIGGIVVVVSAHDILVTRGNAFESTAHFLDAYFSKAGYTALKQSIVLMITKFKSNRQAVKSMLRKMIQTSHQRRCKTSAKDIDPTSLAAVQPFFEMLLKNPVQPGKENDIKNFRLDNEKVIFFDPCSQKSIEKTFSRLHALHPLDDQYLSHFDNPLSQYLRKEILYTIADEVKEEVADIFALQQEIKIQALQLKGKASKEALQGLINQLKNQIRELEKKQNTTRG